MKFPESICIDSSVAMAWFYATEATRQTDDLLDYMNQDGHAVVPGHWFLEVCNTLLMGERHHHGSAAATTHFLEILGALSIETDPETAVRAGTTTLALARSHGLTLQDAAYLELSMRRNLVLATVDAELRTAAKKAGIRCYPLTLNVEH